MPKKIQIHQFDPIIYPIKFWIIKNPSVKFLKENFEGIDEEEFNPIEAKHSTAAVWDRPIMLKKTRKYGIVLSIYNMKDFDASSMAHEATHITDIIWDWIQEKDLSMRSEANAYLVGWVVKCMWEVATNKFKYPA